VESPSTSATASIAPKKPEAKVGGVVDTLPTTNLPSGEIATASVKVPPMSTPIL
jgi:hypothetical protein